jgi:hypothetical protein
MALWLAVVSPARIVVQPWSTAKFAAPEGWRAYSAAKRQLARRALLTALSTPNEGRDAGARTGASWLRWKSEVLMGRVTWRGTAGPGSSH